MLPYVPGSGIVEFDSPTIGNYEKYGTFTLIVAIGGSTCEIVGHIVECCEVLTPDIIAVDEPINNYTTTGNFDNELILIFGDVTFNAGTYDFDNCEIRLGPDAELLPSSSTDITFDNGTSLMPYCPCRWDRILLTGTTTELAMEDASMSGALRGIMATNEAPIELIDSDFDNNLVSVYLNNFSTGGSFNGSYLKVDGCTFDATVAANAICYSSSSVNMSTVYPTSAICTNPIMDIVVKNSVDVHVGHENYDPNTFENNSGNDKTAIVPDASQVYVRNNLFYDVTAICSDNDSKLIVGGTMAQGNIIEDCLAFFNESAMFFEENYMSGSSLEFTEPTFEKVATTGYDAGTQFNTNSFYESDLLIDGNGNPHDATLRVYDNTFTFTEVEMIDYPLKISGFAPNLRRIVFHSNDMVQDNNATLVKVEDCGYMVFANNSFDNLVYRAPSNANEYKGVKWKNSVDGVVSNNYFRNFNRAIDVHGDNSGVNHVDGTQFTCNEFVNCYHPFHLNDVTLEDQGASNKATDNCFQYYYTGSYPYGDQIAGSLSTGTIDWYMRETTTCNSGFQPFSSCYCLKSAASGVVEVGNATPNVCVTPSNKSAGATVEVTWEDQNKPAIEESDLLTIFPNPSDGKVQVLINSDTLNSKVVIYNSQGQVIKILENLSNQFEFDVSGWSAGVYFIKAQTKVSSLIVK